MRKALGRKDNDRSCRQEAGVEHILLLAKHHVLFVYKQSKRN